MVTCVWVCTAQHNWWGVGGVFDIAADRWASIVGAPCCMHGRAAEWAKRARARAWALLATLANTAEVVYSPKSESLGGPTAWKSSADQGHSARGKGKDEHINCCGGLLFVWRAHAPLPSGASSPGAACTHAPCAMPYGSHLTITLLLMVPKLRTIPPAFQAPPVTCTLRQRESSEGVGSSGNMRPVHAAPARDE